MSLHQRPSGPTCARCVLGGSGFPCGSGFAAPSGEMRSGVMIVTAALADEQEVHAKRALAGAGGYLLQRAYMANRWKLEEEFRLVPALFCKPSAPLWIPGKGGQSTRLHGWAASAVTTCATNLDAEIDRWQPKAIVALGETALAALTGVEMPIMATRGYVFRERKDRAWVVPTFDPTWVQQGNTPYAHFLRWDTERAVAIARDGYEYEKFDLLLDPPVAEWDAFVEGYLADPSQPLAIDIETPWAKDADEDELDGEETPIDHTYTILRVSVCYDGKRAASVSWTMPYVLGIQRMLAAGSAS